MIKSNIEIHDKFSVTVELTYNRIFNRRKTKYTTITYLFLPDSLNINSRTYPPSKFYNDSRLFLKYDTPIYSLNDIAVKGNILLRNLEKSIDLFTKTKSVETQSRFENQIRMFATVFCSLLREETNLLIDKEKSSNEDIASLLKNTRLSLSEFRLATSLIKESMLKPKYQNVVYYADEHMSNVVELQLMKLFNSLQKRGIHKNGLESIVALINSEQKYKKQEQFVSPKDKNVDPEDLLFKRNRLKKYIESVFFLKQNTRRDGTVFEQTLLAIAAGLAMIFSTAIAFYYQQLYGNFTLPFFIALVVGYMLKDRIKVLVSSMFVSKSNSFFHDYKIRVTNALGEKIGLIKEKFSFVSVKSLGANTKKHRRQDMVLEISEELLNEQIIEYKKKIIIYPEKFGNDLSVENINGLTDITRLNFHRFIRYMDDPKKDYIMVKKGEVYINAANKVYHINLIQKYYTEEGVEFSRYRIIINRNGIKRIERVDLDPMR